MSGIGGGVLPHRGAGNLGTGIIAVAEQGDEIGVDIICHDIGVVIVQLSEGQLILHTQDHSGLVQRENGGDAQVGPHNLQKLVGGDTGIVQKLRCQVFRSQGVYQGVSLLPEGGVGELTGLRARVIGGTFFILRRGLLEQIIAQGRFYILQRF